MKFKQLLTKTLLVAVGLLAGQSVWAAVGDKTTNLDIDFSNAISEGKVVGTTGSMTIGGSNTAISNGILIVGNGTSSATLTGSAAGSGDKVEVTFDLAFGKLSGKNVWFRLKDSSSNIIGEFNFCPYSGTISTNTFGVATGDIYYANNTVLWDRKVSFTITLDYKARKITTATTCLKSGANGSATNAEHTVDMTNSNPLTVFEIGSNYNNDDRRCSFDNLKVVTTEGEAVTETSYTVNYKLGDNVVKTVSNNGVVDQVVTANVAIDGTESGYEGKHYLITAAEAPSITLVSNAASNVLNVPVRAPYTATLTVTKNIGGEAQTPEVTNLVETDAKVCSWIYAYPMYIKKDGVYYIADVTSTFGESGNFTNGQSIPKTVNYSTVASDVVWFKDIDGATVSDVTYSGGGYTNTDEQLANVTVGAGVYDVDFYVVSKAGSGSNHRNEGVSVNGENVANLTGNVNGPRTLTINVANDGSVITAYGNGSSNHTDNLDYVRIRKSSVSYTVKYMCGNVDIKDADNSRTAVWGTTVELSDEDKADVTFEGKKYIYSSDNASSTTIASDGTSIITVNFDCLGKAETVTYTLNVGGATEDKDKETITSTNESTSTSLNTLVGITNNTGGNYGTGDKKDLTVKIPTDAEYNAEHYMSVGFTVASGCKFTPTSISVTAQPVTTNKTVKLVLTDGTNSIEKTQGNVVAGTPAEIIENNIGATSLTGDVTLKIYCYGATDTYRLGSPITIEGLLDYNDDIKSAIADCKAWETSDEFATYIDGGSYASAEEVYAAHTAWQVANGTASKAILNNTVTSADHFWGTLKDGANYDGAPDTKYLSWDKEYSVNQKVYGIPAGVYEVSAWAYASAAVYQKLYISKVVGNDWTDLAQPETNASGWKKLSATITLTEDANIAFGFYAGAIDGGTTGFDNWTLTKINSVDKTISSAGWSTYCSPYILDFSNTIEKLDAAYIVTGGKNGVLKTTKVEGAVPANTGLLLKGTANASVNIPVAATATVNVAGNKLVGVTASEPLAAGNGYVLMTTPSLAFYKNKNDFTLSANSAYLPVNFDGNGEARSSFLLFGDDVTGISQVAGSEVKTNGAIYNLNGQRVSNPTKGIYIIDGVKVAIE